MTTKIHDGNLPNIPGLVVDSPGFKPESKNYNWDFRCDIVTHAHMDHLHGLESWRSKAERRLKQVIYCSDITRQFIQAKFLGPPDDWFICPKLGEPFDLRFTPADFTTALPSQSFGGSMSTIGLERPDEPPRAIFLDAHHISGSVMILIAYGGKLIFHSGDFRWHDSMREKIRDAKHKLGFSSQDPVANCYLDLTFCHKNCNFQRRRTSIRLITNVIEKLKRNGNFKKLYMRWSCLGSDMILGHLAKHFGWKIFFKTHLEDRRKQFNKWLQIMDHTRPHMTNSEDEATIIALDWARKGDRRQWEWNKHYCNGPGREKREGNVFVLPVALRFIMKAPDMDEMNPIRPEIIRPKDIWNARGANELAGQHLMFFSSHANFEETRKLVAEIRPKNITPISDPCERDGVDLKKKDYGSLTYCKEIFSDLYAKGDGPPTPPGVKTKKKKRKRGSESGGSSQPPRRKSKKKHPPIQNPAPKSWRKWAAVQGGPGGHVEIRCRMKSEGARLLWENGQGPTPPSSFESKLLVKERAPGWTPQSSFENTPFSSLETTPPKSQRPRQSPASSAKPLPAGGVKPSGLRPPPRRSHDPPRTPPRLPTPPPRLPTPPRIPAPPPPRPPKRRRRSEREESPTATSITSSPRPPKRKRRSEREESPTATSITGSPQTPKRKRRPEREESPTATSITGSPQTPRRKRRPEREDSPTATSITSSLEAESVPQVKEEEGAETERPRLPKSPVPAEASRRVPKSNAKVRGSEPQRRPVSSSASDDAPRLEIAQTSSNTVVPDHTRYWDQAPTEDELEHYRRMLTNRWLCEGWQLEHPEQWPQEEKQRVQKLADTLGITLVNKRSEARWLILPVHLDTLSGYKMHDTYIPHLQRRLLELRFKFNDDKIRWIVGTELLEYLRGLYKNWGVDWSGRNVPSPPGPVWASSDYSETMERRLFGQLRK